MSGQTARESVNAIPRMSRGHLTVNSRLSVYLPTTEPVPGLIIKRSNSVADEMTKWRSLYFNQGLQYYKSTSDYSSNIRKLFPSSTDIQKVLAICRNQASTSNNHQMIRTGQPTDRLDPKFWVRRTLGSEGSHFSARAEHTILRPSYLGRPWSSMAYLDISARCSYWAILHHQHWKMCVKVMYLKSHVVYNVFI